jgi:hypothetical protein
MVRPLLLKILLLCFSDSSNFFLMKVQNWNNPTLAGVKLSLFCQFWQQHHAPQISRCVRCLGTIIGSPVKLLCPNLCVKWPFSSLTNSQKSGGKSDLHLQEKGVTNSPFLVQICSIFLHSNARKL